VKLWAVDLWIPRDLTEIRSKVFLDFRVDLNQLMKLGFRASLSLLLGRRTYLTLYLKPHGRIQVRGGI
jgi:hypothetical protein